MAYERLRNSGLTQGLTDLLADLSDLVQKEIQLAKAEVTEKITSRLRASVWMMAAAILGLIAGCWSWKRPFLPSPVSDWLSIGRVYWWAPFSLRPGRLHFIMGGPLRRPSFFRREPSDKSHKT